MNIRNRCTKVCLFLWVLGMCFAAHPLHAQSVIPVPLKIEQGTGSFLLSEKTKLYTNIQGGEARLLESYLQALPVHLKKGKKKDTQNVLSLLITEKSEQLPSPESYTLSVTPERILIRATSGAGLFYGIQTLLQLSQPSETGYSIASVEVQDSPRFAYRGLMLDVSRHFFSKEFVKKQIDALAFYKINRLHLHLTDAAGWRIEIKKYPLLTEFAAWRTDANWKTWWNGGRKYLRFDEPGASGGYYTQDDIREIVEYARQHFITIIPEIEMPAHSEEVLAAYPQLSCAGEPYKNADFCIGNEETFTFLENVLTEVMALFPSEYIHIGGDEAGMAAWKTCPKCQKRMKDEHLSHVDELQSYLIHRIEKFLNDHGRRLLGWDEILKGGLAPNATVMSWRGEEGGITAVTSGHRAIMTPGGYCYLDSYQDAPYSQPEAIGGYLPLKKVYSYNPVSTSLSAEQAKLVYDTFDLKSEIGSRPESLQPLTHLALGKKVIYNAPYNSSYAAQGDVTLTDGIRGDWTYGDGAWQGFISKNRLDVTVDMENETTIHSVTAAFMQVVGAEVFLPASVVISVSDDGVNFTELKHQDFVVNKEEAIKFSDVSWEGTVKGRYVRYQARAGKELGGWIFTDEIIVK